MPPWPGWHFRFLACVASRIRSSPLLLSMCGCGFPGLRNFGQYCHTLFQLGLTAGRKRNAPLAPPCQLNRFPVLSVLLLSRSDREPLRTNIGTSRQDRPDRAARLRQTRVRCKPRASMQFAKKAAETGFSGRTQRTVSLGMSRSVQMEFRGAFPVPTGPIQKDPRDLRVGTRSAGRRKHVSGTLVLFLV
jgi:hypothetical protein